MDAQLGRFEAAAVGRAWSPLFALLGRGHPFYDDHIESFPDSYMERRKGDLAVGKKAE